MTYAERFQHTADKLAKTIAYYQSAKVMGFDDTANHYLDVWTGITHALNCMEVSYSYEKRNERIVEVVVEGQRARVPH